MGDFIQSNYITIIILVLFFVAVYWLVLRRLIVRLTGIPAEATILMKKFGRGGIVSAGSSHSIIAKQLILDLEVKLKSGQTYKARDRVMVNAMNLMSMEPGSTVQVRINRFNSNHVVVLPGTLRIFGTASKQTRANAAISDVMSQLSKSPAQPGDVHKRIIESLKSKGLEMQPAPQNPNETLKKLKELLDQDLITQKEYDDKKTELLAKL